MTETVTDTLNRPLLLETLAYIEAHPENWDQGAWATINPGKDPEKWTPDNVCGTSFCFAGRALVDSGFVPYISHEALLSASEWGDVNTDYFIPAKLAKTLSRHFKKTGDWLPVDSAQKVDPFDQGAKLLGLSENDADVLFGGNNTLQNLREMVAHLLIHGNLKKCYENEDDE